jgi:hypothetical protein
MVRGIERRKILGNGADSDHFVSRLGKVLEKTEKLENNLLYH